MIERQNRVGRLNLTVDQILRRKELSSRLRSRKYRQEHGVLQSSEGKNCCLGVACHQFIDETGRGEFRQIEPDTAFFFALGEGSHRTSDRYEPPKEVREYFGMIPEESGLMMEQNDSSVAPLKFYQIARSLDRRTERAVRIE